MDRMNVFNDKNLVHYEGVLGIFNYDPEEFKIGKMWYLDYLYYHGNGKSVNLPEGCTNTRFMFCDCKLPEGFTLGENFDTSKVTSMTGMFSVCRLPQGFSLGKNFDTSNVTDMISMFRFCKIPEGFSLGESFNTSKVNNMASMFGECKIPEGFSLGSKFDTSNVIDMSYMFAECELPRGFSLGKKFDTSNVTDMKRMFQKCELPIDFSLGKHFHTSNVTDMEHMFRECKYSGIDICEYFKTQNDKELILMLCGLVKLRDGDVENNDLIVLMKYVSEELQVSTSVIQRMLKPYLKSLINK